MRLFAIAVSAALYCLPAHSAEIGKASWYGAEAGRKTANGERFNPNGMTCARRRGRFGEMLKVTDVSTGKSIICRLNDRGPFTKGRIIDLSRGSARALGMLNRGEATVKIEHVK